MLEDGYLADLPIVIAAIDPCFSCTDRVIAGRATCARRPTERHELGGAARGYGIEWYRERGHRLRASNQHAADRRIDD